MKKYITPFIILIVSLLNVFAQTNWPPPGSGSAEYNHTTNTYLVDTTLLQFTNGPVTDNRLYSLSRSASPNGPWTYVSTVVGGSIVSIGVTNEPLFIKATNDDGYIIDSATIVAVGPAGSGCNSHRIGYSTYNRPIPVWGWWPDTNHYTQFTVRNLTRTNVCVTAFGNYGDYWEHTGGILVLSGQFSPAYRFSTIFSNSLPANVPGSDKLFITGFKPDGSTNNNFAPEDGTPVAGVFVPEIFR